jgi:hypothetical protein
MVPSEGYTARDNFSRFSIQWLEWTMAKETEKKKKHVRIRHTLNGGKHRVCGTRYRLDGYDEESMTAYEFLGDFFYDIYIYI